ncbi:MAG: asparagine synthase C-terminal domain-containing protein [Rhodococcus sp. (in: high G+C Gram-positive bacteria)]|uniref:asparagine synthase C-terminal domain-containing protein n=1 Tax=Rhodococcus sp. SBT000017 TaxID=1803385 RepID=UPI001604C2FE|nr:asparagine synthase C-terminal domain-containing protein [Rhodococcus sp. SBT000017]
MSDSLRAPLEYVSDIIDVRMEIKRTVDSPSTAARTLIDYLERRITALTSDRGLEHGIMLSGGIDSILVAAVARRLSIDLVAVTYAVDAPQLDGSHNDETGAVAVAKHLGFEHHVVRSSTAELLDSAIAASKLLNSTEIWEISSAVPIRACFKEFSRLGINGPILTGSGADALFLGGKRLNSPVSSSSAIHEMNSMIEQQVLRNFSRKRLIPDFFERILGESCDRFVQIFQTVEAWQFSKTLLPSALFSTNGNHEDKLCLRMAAEMLGVPRELTRSKKDPIQYSSGVVGGIVLEARKYLAQLPGAETYTSPLTEPLDLSIARLFLLAPQVRDRSDDSIEQNS